MADTPTHFGGKKALDHVVEVQAKGMIASQEIHGAETPGHISAAADAARDTGALYLLFSLLFAFTAISGSLAFLLFALLSISWLVWKMGRSAWLAWMRLERLHRLVSEEKWEIEHHRDQERSELTELYAAKGFQGKLLEDVIDVLMADGDRLLRVMLEEELGLTLEKQDHPLKEALGAGVGTLLAFAIGLTGFLVASYTGLMIGALFAMGIAGWISAHFEKNRRIPAVIWNVGLGIASYSAAYFLLSFFGQG